MEYGTSSRARRYVFGPGDDEVLVQYFTSPTFNAKTWYLQDERNSVINTGTDAGAHRDRISRIDCKASIKRWLPVR